MGMPDPGGLSVAGLQRRWPAFGYGELWLVLFVFAGVLKAIPALSSALPLDLTATFGLLLFTAIALRIVATGGIRRFPITRTDLWLVALCCALAVGVLYTASDRSYALEKLFSFAVLGVLAVYVLPRWLACYCRSYEVFIRRVLVAWVVVAGVLSALAFLIAPGLGFARSLGGSYLSWGHFLGGAIVGDLVLLLSAKTQRQRIVLFLLLPLLLGAMTYARARGPLIGLAVVLLVMAMAGLMVPLRRRLLVVLVAVSVVGGVLVGMPPDLRHRYSRLFTEDVGGSVLFRVEAYKQALRVFGESPLLGAGTGSYDAFHERFSYPHNILLEALAENGLFGFIALCGFLLSLGARAIGTVRRSMPGKRVLVAGPALILLYMLVGSLVSGDLTSRSLLFAAGLAAAACSRKKTAGRIPNRFPGEATEDQSGGPVLLRWNAVLPQWAQGGSERETL